MPCDGSISNIKKLQRFTVWYAEDEKKLNIQQRQQLQLLRQYLKHFCFCCSWYFRSWSHLSSMLFAFVFSFIWYTKFIVIHFYGEHIVSMLCTYSLFSFGCIEIVTILCIHFSLFVNSNVWMMMMIMCIFFLFPSDYGTNDDDIEWKYSMYNVCMHELHKLFEYFLLYVVTDRTSIVLIHSNEASWSYRKIWLPWTKTLLYWIEFNSFFSSFWYDTVEEYFFFFIFQYCWSCDQVWHRRQMTYRHQMNRTKLLW